jgi:hypothetical protein
MLSVGKSEWDIPLGRQSIILKCMLKYYGERVWTGFVWVIIRYRNKTL